VRCGRRRVDPDSGPSTWRRAVLAGHQVLVCPDCQVEGWTAGLDACARCGSTMLVKQLGVVSCRACGASDAVSAASGPSSAPGAPPDDRLSAEVDEALGRVLGRPPGDG
jgi:hypothetical protein